MPQSKHERHANGRGAPSSWWRSSIYVSTAINDATTPAIPTQKDSGVQVRRHAAGVCSGVANFNGDASSQC